MSLTARQIANITNHIDDKVDYLKDGLFLFDDVSIGVSNPVISGNSVSVRIRITADDADEGRIEQALNLFNVYIDGSTGTSNPRINFDDETPGTPLRTTDTFKLTFTPGSGLDFVDI